MHTDFRWTRTLTKKKKTEWKETKTKERKEEKNRGGEKEIEVFLMIKSVWSVVVSNVNPHLEKLAWRRCQKVAWR